MEDNLQIRLTFDHLLNGSRLTPLFKSTSARSRLRVLTKTNMSINCIPQKLRNTTLQSTTKFTLRVLVRIDVGLFFSKASISSMSSTTGNICQIIIIKEYK